jgi:monoamine oxidase
VVPFRTVAEPGDEVLDVAIVGAGVAGTYTAWRLLCDVPPRDRPPKIAIFEGSDRVGGRLLSLKPPGMDHLVCELGGMFFTNVFPLVCGLAKRLGLAVQSMPGSQQDLRYLRRVRLANDAKTVPYHFTDAEKLSSPDALLANAIDALVPGVLRLHGAALDERLRTATVDGIHLADWGFWNLLYRKMSSEAFAYTSDTNPDDYSLINWNAADAIRSMQLLNVDGIQVFHATDGYAGIPQTMAAAVEGAGAAVKAKHRLKRFAMEGDLVRLELAADSRGWGPAAAGRSVTVRARKLVLAMPRRSLELLEQTGPVFESAAAQAMLASVTPIPMFKMYSCYATPWWKALGYGPQGYAITDMPLRACMYWGTEGDQPGADPGNTHSLLLTTLDDMMASSFWAGLRDPHHGPVFAPRAAAVGPALLGALPGSPRWRQYADCTTDRIVREAQRQLSEVHGIDVPEPYAVASMNWNQDPFGGAADFWKIHARSEDVMERMTQPVDGVPVYVCGDSFSRTQGWVEGALESAELMLQRRFGLAPPSWTRP